ncbi:MAG TPA: hypothetical protein VEU08_13250 [Vicinamibacterales bacterium]|nr:hypothetical protein [Vicinamibacterales bacterium]
MRRTYVAVFLLTLTSLTVEVLLTRVFDVLLWQNLSFMVISCAMFGLAAGGLRDVLAPVDAAADSGWTLSKLSMAFGLSVWAIPLLLNAIPFSIDRAGTHLTTQAIWFLLLYLVVFAPFFFVGWCLCRIFSTASQHIRHLYFYDLSGAALGTVLIVPLVQPFGPERLLLIASLVAVSAAAVLSATARWRMVLGGTAIGMAVVPVLIGPRYLTLALHDDKRGTSSEIALGRLEVSTWDPISQIAVLDEPTPTFGPQDRGHKHIAYDGGSQTSTFYPFDGDFQALRRELPNRLMAQFWQRGVIAAHYLKRDTNASTLIIGSAGGQETKAALMYGAAHVDAIEMVGTVVRLATGRYADYIGHLFDRPGVHVQVAEGRSFLRATPERYDVIQIFSNYTTSSVAEGAGAVSPAYLVTTDAFREYFTHLRPNGILQINHLFYPRVVSTAAAAWQSLGRNDFRRHVVVVHHQEPIPDYLPTILIQMSPWTPGQMADLSSFFGFPAVGEAPYRIAEDPLRPDLSFLPDVFYGGHLPQALVRTASVDMTPATDDHPFFRFVRRTPTRLTVDRGAGADLGTVWALNTELFGGWLPKDWVHLIGAAAASLFYGALFILLPMVRSSVGRERWAGKASTLAYFSLLGVGFITIELVFIQRFTKLIGYPLYAIVTVLAVVLVGAAIGSRMSARVVGTHSQRWPVAFAGVVASGLLLWLVQPALSRVVMTQPLPVRLAAAAGMMLPQAFFMGMPFPIGILALSAKPRGAIAWAWSTNGFFTNVGGVGSALLSLWLGFRATVLVALAAYGLAAITFHLLRRTTFEVDSQTIRRQVDRMRVA